MTVLNVPKKAAIHDKITASRDHISKSKSVPGPVLHREEAVSLAVRDLK